MKREQWNLFSLKVLTRLAQADDLQIDVKVAAKLKEGQSVDPLNAAQCGKRDATGLPELGVSGPVHVGLIPNGRRRVNPSRSSIQGPLVLWPGGSRAPAGAASK